MNYDNLTQAITDFLLTCPDNYISEGDAMRPDLVGMRIYDAPLFGVGAADDPIFEKFKKPEIVDPGVMLPADWVPNAKSVLSFFLPFSEQVRVSNRPHTKFGSDEWFHGRIEGTVMMHSLGAFICAYLEREGYQAAFPAGDPRFHWIGNYCSNWSERHTAYACGLGTFGLSKGLITKRGVAGRFGSVITSAVLPVTEREYSSPFEYCTMCGKCQINCPAGAIDKTRGVIHGKDHPLCSAHVASGKTKPHGIHQRVRFGCGKCQVDVPCETGIPGRE